MKGHTELSSNVNEVCAHQINKLKLNILSVSVAVVLYKKRNQGQSSNSEFTKLYHDNQSWPLAVCHPHDIVFITSAQGTGKKGMKPFYMSS